jgi:hypothetical protein
MLKEIYFQVVPSNTNLLSRPEYRQSRITTFMSSSVIHPWSCSTQSSPSIQTSQWIVSRHTSLLDDITKLMTLTNATATALCWRWEELSYSYAVCVPKYFCVPELHTRSRLFVIHIRYKCALCLSVRTSVLFRAMLMVGHLCVWKTVCHLPVTNYSKWLRSMAVNGIRRISLWERNAYFPNSISYLTWNPPQQQQAATRKGVSQNVQHCRFMLLTGFRVTLDVLCVSTTLWRRMGVRVNLHAFWTPVLDFDKGTAS